MAEQSADRTGSAEVNVTGWPQPWPTFKQSRLKGIDLRNRLLVLALVGALVLAACASDEDADSAAVAESGSPNGDGAAGVEIDSASVSDGGAAADPGSGGESASPTDASSDPSDGMADGTADAEGVASSPDAPMIEGEPAPDFTLALADGTSYTLSEGAKPVYMVFWAEW
jgi:hypothetical protein